MENQAPKTAEGIPSMLELPGGVRLAYHHTPASRPDSALPGILFCGGFMSDMTGTKATALESWAVEQGRAFTRFDYQGHGQSSGTFEEGTIGMWTEDAIAILDHICERPQIIVGSSMGGWVMLLAALARPEKVKALVGIASATDFTETLLWDTFSDAEKQTLQTEGRLSVPNCYDEEPYPITMQLIEEGRKHLLLKDKSLPIRCPVRLLHGMRDEDVPWQLSTELTEKLESDDVIVKLVKNGDHRMSEPAQLKRLFAMIESLDG